jgi:hypothetical protein
MKLMRSTRLIAVAVALIALTAGTAAAQAPVVTWQPSGSGIRVEWTPISGATHYEAFVTGTLSAGPIPIPTSYFQVTPPPGTYVVQIRAMAGSVAGPLSAPLTIAFTGAPAVACDTVSAPTVTASVSGMNVTISWNAVAGAAGYRLQVGTTPGATQYSIDLPPHQTTFSGVAPMLGTFYVRVAAGSACGALSTSSEQSFTVGAATPGPAPAPVAGSGPRTPDPAAGQRLPLPGYAAQIVRDMSIAYRGDLLNSCVEHGGNNTFLYRVVQALRQLDSRWGLNWKRGNRGDMSQDVVTYHFGAGPDEDSTDVYIIDMIGGHCGNSPSWNWEDVTAVTYERGAIGRWTLQPYLARGWPADSRR